MVSAEVMRERGESEPLTRLIAIAGLCWLAMAGWDFFLHAGLLASLYVESQPFLLSPAEAFKRIPLGYLSFFVSAVMLLWLTMKVGVRGWLEGFAFGLTLGLFVQGASAIGLVSISTAHSLLLAGWFVGGAIQLGIGGIVIGDALAERRLLIVLARVIAFVVIMVTLVITMQNFGLAPAARI
jgi:hypothetical protein